MKKSSERNHYQSEIDQFGINVLEDLLSGTSEWRQVSDVIRLSFRGIYDIVRNQGEFIKDLERNIVSKVSKQEYLSSLTSKANTGDVGRAMNDLAVQVDSKLSLEEFQSFMKDYVGKPEFQIQLQSKVSSQDFYSILNEKIITLQSENKQPLMHYQGKLEELRSEMSKRFQQVVGQKEMETVIRELQQKVDRSELEEELEQKCSRQSVQSALQNKVNRGEFENLLQKKAELIDVQSIVEQILQEKLHHIPAPSVIPNIQSQIQQLSLKLDNFQNDLYDSCSVSEERMMIIKKEAQQFNDSLKTQVEQLKVQMPLKMSRNECEKLYQLVGSKLDSKEGLGQIELTRNEIYEDLNVLKSELNFQKRHFEDLLHEKTKKQEQTNDKTCEVIQRIRDQVKDQLEEKKVEMDEFSKMMKNQLQMQKKEFLFEIDHIVQSLTKASLETQVQLETKVDKLQYSESQLRVDTLFEQKVDLIEVQNALNSCQSDIQSRFMEFKEEFRGLLSDHDQEFFQILNKKVNIIDVTQALSSKVDLGTFAQLFKDKVNVAEFDELVKLTESFGREVQMKCDLKDFEEFSTHSTYQFDEIKRDLHSKANLREFHIALDKKSNHDEVGRAFQEIQKEMSRKSNLDDAIVNESLCSENILGRWTYKQAPLCQGSLVPWSAQVVNTLPDNFLWEKDKPTILVVAPGLYELTFGFYAKKKPKVDVLVNGEVIIGAVNSGSYVVHHSSGKLKDVKNSVGYVTGLTLLDFIVLPARARISIAYQGDTGEGFMGLRRI